MSHKVHIGTTSAVGLSMAQRVRVAKPDTLPSFRLPVFRALKELLPLAD